MFDPCNGVWHGVLSGYSWGDENSCLNRYVVGGCDINVLGYRSVWVVTTVGVVLPQEHPRRKYSERWFSFSCFGPVYGRDPRVSPTVSDVDHKGGRCYPVQETKGDFEYSTP